MKLVILLILVLFLIGIVGCNSKESMNIDKTQITDIKQVADKTQITEKTQMANPAAVKCVQDGYKYDIVNTEQGQSGKCIISEKVICDEWAYYRGECK